MEWDAKTEQMRYRKEASLIELELDQTRRKIQLGDVSQQNRYDQRLAVWAVYKQLGELDISTKGKVVARLEQMLKDNPLEYINHDAYSPKLLIEKWKRELKKLKRMLVSS